MSMERPLRPWFEAYVDAFNRNDFAGFGAYYADDVIFQGRPPKWSGAMPCWPSIAR